MILNRTEDAIRIEACLQTTAELRFLFFLITKLLLLVQQMQRCGENFRRCL